MDDNFWKETERATGMTLDERFSEGFKLFEQGRDYIAQSIQEAFPEASPDDVRRIRDVVLRRARTWGIT